MKPTVLALVVLVLAFGCTQKPVPVASDTVSTNPAERLAIAVEYVAIPTMQVHARPAADAPVVTSYGFQEAISILERQGEWVMIRTAEGAGWVKGTDLMSPERQAGIDPLVPRFYQAPVAVPFHGRGELNYQARVNTDGDVVEVKLVKNTTGSDAVATANGEALQQAKFYPMVDGGSRKTFIYEHRIYY